jgi:photosystem II stability/assembly factor-like uncharacterized protein
VTVTTPPGETDRDLERRVAELEALIEEARRRARRRRIRNAAAALAVAGTGIAALIGFGGDGGVGAGSATSAQAPAANAGSPPLGALPPDAGLTQSFAFDPTAPGTVYAGTLGVPHGSVLNGHVFKTTDAGQHWQSTNHTDPGWTRVDSLTADPRHPGTLYAGTGVAVYKTVNGGSSWRAWSRGLLPGRNPRPGVGDPGWRRVEGWVTSLAVDPTNSKVVYAAAGGIRKSTDGGHTWRVLRAGTSLADGASTLAIAPTSPHVVYAIWYHHSTSVYESANAGATWRQTGLRQVSNPDGYGHSLAVDPLHPTTVYASIGRKVFKSTDAGQTWQSIADGLRRHVVSALAVDPRRSGTVYAALEVGGPINRAGGIYKTTNGGRSWSRAISTPFPVYSVAVDPARPATIYASGAVLPKGGVSILRSTDGGRTWKIAA